MQKNTISTQLSRWERPADNKTVEETIAALRANGIGAEYAQNEKDALEKALKLIPEYSEVMTMTSVTLDSIGITEILNDSGKYASIRNTLMNMDRKTEGKEMQKMGAAPDYSISSAHAVTKDGKILIASATGSQLPAAAYGAEHVIFVVGTQKIVNTLDEGMKRIYEHSLPLESERAKKAYGVPGSTVGKILVINKEPQQGRINVIFVGKPIGF